MRRDSQARDMGNAALGPEASGGNKRRRSSHGDHDDAKGGRSGVSSSDGKYSLFFKSCTAKAEVRKSRGTEKEKLHSHFSSQKK